MKLTIKERLLITTMLPEEGNRLTMKALKDINTKIAFSAEELDKYNMSMTENGSIQYSNTEDTFDIDLNDAELKIICDNYLKLDTEGKLNPQTFDIGERIYDLVGEK